MIDFKQLRKKRAEDEAIEPKIVFEGLRKPDNYDDLRNSQAEVLSDWFEKRNSKNTLIKLNTGGGKTLVGLLIAISSARELKRGALYLVESRQLAHQVFLQAQSLGIKASEYKDKTSIDSEFKNGRSILIATYSALFNGRSSFGVGSSLEPVETSVVIIDDAHSSFSSVQDAFTLVIRKDDDPQLYLKLCAQFGTAFHEIDCGATFDEFYKGDDKNTDAVLQVPFWAWYDRLHDIRRLISDAESECPGYKRAVTESKEDRTTTSIRFKWNLLKNDLKYCRATISRDAFSISPLLSLVDKFPTYRDAPRRVFMSATFGDEGALARTFNCPLSDVHRIVPDTLAGIGRRMILFVDGEEDIERFLSEKMQELCSAGKGSIVLSPSFADAKRWAQYGVKVVLPGEVACQVEYLRAGKTCEPVTFANRYNGLDLPGDACRLLIVSGLPVGLSDNDRVLANYAPSSRLFVKGVVQRLEQAIGRGTRGAGDYCVVVLLGHELCDWVKDESHLAFFSSSTKAQIKCGEDIGENVDLSDTKILGETIDQGVSDDPDFNSYLMSFMQEESGIECDDKDDLVAFSQAERKAFSLWRNGEDGKAIDKLINYSGGKKSDEQLKGLSLQVAGQIAYASGDKEMALQLQGEAHSLNLNLPKAPPRMGLQEEMEISQQARSLIDYLGSIKGKHPLDKFNELTAVIGTDCAHKAYEAALMHLGEFIGANSQRFDRGGSGPDVGWVFEGDRLALALEAKNEKKSDKPLCKDEEGQLLTAVEFLKEKYPDYECIGISVHPNAYADRNASASNTLVLTLDAVRELRDEARLMLESLVPKLCGVGGIAQECEQLLNDHSLRGHQIIKHYTTHFGLKG